MLNNVARSRRSCGGLPLVFLSGRRPRFRANPTQRHRYANVPSGMGFKSITFALRGGIRLEGFVRIHPDSDVLVQFQGATASPVGRARGQRANSLILVSLVAFAWVMTWIRWQRTLQSLSPRFSATCSTLSFDSCTPGPRSIASHSRVVNIISFDALACAKPRIWLPI